MRNILATLIVSTTLLLAPQAAPADRQGAPSPAQAAEQARAQYLRILAALEAKGRLDDDTVLLARTTRILAGIVAVIPAERRRSGTSTWEAHVTSEPRVDAIGMPGGYLLIGTAFVARLALDDAELATLIAHEVGHVVAGHRPAAASSSMETDASEQLRLAQAALAQESEADAIGMELAHRGGWPAAGIVRFYEKLAAADPGASFSSTHPHPASRLARAREIAATWQRGAN